jgi:hypothetical protein
LPTIAARVAAVGPDGVELGKEIVHQFDSQTAIVRKGFPQFIEMSSADQITLVAISFVTAVGAELTAKWIWNKLHVRKGAWIEMEGLRIELDEGRIREFLLDKLKIHG